MAGSVEFSIRDDYKKMEKMLSDARRQALPKAAQAALNRAAGSAYSASVKAMARETGMKQKDIRAGVKLRKARMGNLTAAIEGRGRPLNLIRFAAKQLKKSVKAKPWGKTRTYRQRVFIANQGRTVFIRDKETGKIRGMYGASIARELVRETVSDWVDERFHERWPIEIERALNNEMRKLGFRT